MRSRVSPASPRCRASLVMPRPGQWPPLGLADGHWNCKRDPVESGGSVPRARLRRYPRRARLELFSGSIPGQNLQHDCRTFNWIVCFEISDSQAELKTNGTTVTLTRKASSSKPAQVPSSYRRPQESGQGAPAPTCQTQLANSDPVAILVVNGHGQSEWPCKRPPVARIMIHTWLLTPSYKEAAVRLAWLPPPGCDWIASIGLRMVERFLSRFQHALSWFPAHSRHDAQRNERMSSCRIRADRRLRSHDAVGSRIISHGDGGSRSRPDAS